MQQCDEIRSEAFILVEVSKGLIALTNKPGRYYRPVSLNIVTLLNHFWLKSSLDNALVNYICVFPKT